MVVHLGCGDGGLAAALRTRGQFLVHGLDADDRNVRQARRNLLDLGVYGHVSVDRFDGRHLPYADSLINLLVAEDLGDVPMDEVMRVLSPRGVACVESGGAWTKVAKAWPEGMDEWSHWDHGADGNPVSQDVHSAFLSGRLRWSWPAKS